MAKKNPRSDAKHQAPSSGQSGTRQSGIQIASDLPSADERDDVSPRWPIDSVLSSVRVDLAQLTLQQQAVLREFVCEPNDQRIARRLDLRPQTVRNHLSRIQRKLKVNGRAELMKVAIAGLTSDDDRDLS